MINLSFVLFVISHFGKNHLLKEASNRLECPAHEELLFIDDSKKLLIKTKAISREAV